jgi:hypothetical protein
LLIPALAGATLHWTDGLPAEAGVLVSVASDAAVHPITAAISRENSTFSEIPCRALFIVVS